MSDGTSLNAKLAAMMPLAPDAEQRIKDTNAHFEGDTEYTVTATPRSGWYGIVSGGIGEEATGDTAGAPVSLSFTPVNSGGTVSLIFSAGASATGTDEGQASIVSLSLSHQRQE